MRRRIGGLALAAAAPRRSCALTDLLAEEPGGPEDEHDDEHGEHRRPRASARAQLRPLMTSMKPMMKPPSTAPGDVADAAQHGRGEGLESGDEAHVEADGAEVQAVDDARRAGERGADEERQRRWCG